MTHTYSILLGMICLTASAASVLADSAPVRTRPFPDVPKSHWAFDAVEGLRQKGILRGYPPEPSKPKDVTAKPRKPAPHPHKRRSA